MDNISAQMTRYLTEKGNVHHPHFLWNQLVTFKVAAALLEPSFSLDS